MKITRILSALCAAAVLSVGAGFAIAQPSGQVQSINPLTRDLGSLRTMTAQGAATVTTADQNGFNVSRVICVFRQSTNVGTPSTTFSIQNKDAASGQYYSILTSAAVTTGVSTNFIAAGAGIVDSANVRASVPIAKTWRVSATIAGATASVTGTIGCSVQ